MWEGTACLQVHGGHWLYTLEGRVGHGQDAETPTFSSMGHGGRPRDILLVRGGELAAVHDWTFGYLSTQRFRDTNPKHMGLLCFEHTSYA